MIEKGFAVDVIPFIQTENITTKEVQQQIENIALLNTTIVFTSAIAVKAVTKYLQKIPDWKIYCIGNTTRILVENLFGKISIIATADNAKLLGEKIIEDNFSNEVYFFCGDKRRNELPELLNQHGIEVTEIQVYQTKMLSHKINKNYNGILFFSPSAVESFFQNNLVNNESILFAIGATTANEIKKFSKNKIVVSDRPGKENLIEKVIDYFNN
ncbi:MAG: uroporphyrinogen-III synthase [Parafilimonas sp.]